MAPFALSQSSMSCRAASASGSVTGNIGSGSIMGVVLLLVLVLAAALVLQVFFFTTHSQSVNVALLPYYQLTSSMSGPLVFWTLEVQNIVINASKGSIDSIKLEK